MQLLDQSLLCEHLQVLITLIVYLYRYHPAKLLSEVDVNDVQGIHFENKF